MKKWFLLFLLVSQFSLNAQEVKLNFNQLERAVVVVKIFDSNGRMLGHGSGFFINSNGDFVTNFHVVEGASILKVMLNDGTEYNVSELLRYHEIKDLAVCRIDNPNHDILKYLKLSESGVSKGETCWAIGTPADDIQQINTLSQGIVSNYHSNGYFFKDSGIHLWKGTRLIQVTAAFTHGSSGGALINSKGEVIGVTCGGDATDDGNRANINFAVDIIELNQLKEEKIEINPKSVVNYAMLTVLATSQRSVGCDIYLDGEQLGKIIRFNPNLVYECGSIGALNKPLKEGDHILAVGKWKIGFFEKSYHVTYFNFFVEAGGCRIISLDEVLGEDESKERKESKPSPKKEIKIKDHSLHSGLLISSFSSNNVDYVGIPFHLSYTKKLNPEGWGYDVAYTKTKWLSPDSLQLIDNFRISSVRGKYRNLSGGVHYEIGTGFLERCALKASLNYVGFSEDITLVDGTTRTFRTNLIYPSIGGYCQLNLFNWPISAVGYFDIGGKSSKVYFNTGVLIGYSW